MKERFTLEPVALNTELNQTLKIFAIRTLVSFYSVSHRHGSIYGSFVDCVLGTHVTREQIPFNYSLRGNYFWSISANYEQKIPTFFWQPESHPHVCSLVFRNYPNRSELIYLFLKSF